MGKTQTNTPEYLLARIEKLRGAMAKAKVTSLLVTNFPDVSYLTGFEGDDSWAVVTPKNIWLITDSRYEEQVQRECPWVRTVVRRQGLALEVARIVMREKIEKLGIQQDILTLRQLEILQKELKKAGRVKLAPVLEMVLTLRAVKDAREVSLIERASVIAEDAFLAVKASLRVGMTENEIAAALTYEMRKRGAQDSSFDAIVGINANASLPHYRPGEVRLEKDSFILVDWGARFAGYCSDHTRMIFMAEPPRKIREIYGIVKQAQLAAIEAIKPGCTGRQVDKIARDIIKKAGYGKCFRHGLGHGIGRNIHEQVPISWHAKNVLEPGMIITIEPGIYLPGIGGVRLEDDILVTPTGHRVLGELPKDIESAKI